MFDGKVIPITEASISANSDRPFEDVNMEFWGGGTPSEIGHLNESTGIGLRNNTYKSLSLLGSGYNLYYSVWCTNEHELYVSIRFVSPIFANCRTEHARTCTPFGFRTSYMNVELY